VVGFSGERFERQSAAIAVETARDHRSRITT
jgi:hypothetical protein